MIDQQAARLPPQVIFESLQPLDITRRVEQQRSAG